MADDEIDCDALIAPLADLESLRRLKATYVRRFDNLPPEVVADCIQDAIENLLKFCRRNGAKIRDPGAAQAMLQTTIRRRLIDALRRSDIIEFVTYDDDYVALGTRRHADDDGDHETEQEQVVLPGDTDESKRKTTNRKLPPSRSDDEGIENAVVEALDLDHLMEQVLRRLDPRAQRMVVLLIQELTRAEIAKVFGKKRIDRTVDWARVKVCRIFGQLAKDGNDLAEQMFIGAKCPALLASVGGAPPKPR
jgi:RNA polymerase sigma factor (sigma-70 family)